MLAIMLLLSAGMLQQAWYTYEPDGKNFRVELPSKPSSTSSRTVNNAAGRQVTTAQLKMPDAVYSIQPRKARQDQSRDAGRRNPAVRHGQQSHARRHRHPHHQ